MGFLRDLALATARVTLDTLQKAPKPPQGEDEDEAPPPAAGDKKSPPGAAATASSEELGGRGVNPKKKPAPPADDGVEEVDGEEVPPGHTPGQEATPPGQVPPGGVAPVPQPGGITAKPRSIPELEEALSDPKSLFWDPFAIVDALGYKDRPSPITYQTLKAMVWKMPILQAIIQTRTKQVANFSRPQQDKYSTGFRVTMRDKKASASPATELESQSIERWLMHTGTTQNPAGRDSFSAFLQKITRDSLTFDQACFEIVPARSGKPAEFYAVDAATIRIADTTRLFVDPEDTQVVRYVQVYDGLVVAEYTSEEMCFAVRNPATDIRLQQYGQSEVEMLITTVTALLWAWDFNMKMFSQGTSVKGIINFKGAVPEKQLRMFRRQWYAMTAGVENAFKTPIVNSDDLQFVNMQMTNRDMEFSAWMDFLIKIVGAVYGIDPMEINFKYGDSGGGGKSMFESSGTAKLTASKDKGLKPLLEFLEHHINQSLIWPLNPDMMFEFVGLEADSKTEEADLNSKLVKSTHTVNELRAQNDQPPDPYGDIILDPVYLQWRQGQMQAAQPQPIPGAFGPPGEGGPPGAGDDSGGFSAPPDDSGGDAGVGDAGGFPDFGAEKSLSGKKPTLRKGIPGPAAPAKVIINVEV